MGMRGKTQIKLFGTTTLPEYDQAIRGYGASLEMDVELFHSNIEGEVIDRLRTANHEGIDAGLINPVGYANGHPALVEAIRQVKFPMIEVHLTNLAARGGSSQISAVCEGVVAGFGLLSYRLGLVAASTLIESR